MIGAHSIVKGFIIPNNSNPEKSFQVAVQANKNGGIIDFYLPKTVVKPIRPYDTSNKDAMLAYNEAKKEYDAYMKDYLSKRSELLNVFQGRQLSSQLTRTQICNALYSILNRE